MGALTMEMAKKCVNSRKESTTRPEWRQNRPAEKDLVEIDSSMKHFRRVIEVGEQARMDPKN